MNDFSYIKLFGDFNKDYKLLVSKIAYDYNKSMGFLPKSQLLKFRYMRNGFQNMCIMEKDKIHLVSNE